MRANSSPVSGNPSPNNGSIRKEFMITGKFVGASFSADIRIDLPEDAVGHAVLDVLRGFSGTIDRIVSGTDKAVALDLMNQALRDLRVVNKKLDQELPPPTTN